MCACECLVCAIPCGNAISLRLLAGAQCAPPLRSVSAFISAANNLQGMILASSSGTGIALILGQHRTIPALRLKHRSGSCGTASAAPRSPYRHLELCGIALGNLSLSYQQDGGIRSRRNIGYVDISNFCNVHGITAERASFIMFRNGLERSGALGEIPLWAIPPTQLFFLF